MNELEKLKNEIVELKAWKASLEASHSVPLDVQRALKVRIGLSKSGKGVDTEDVTVVSSVNFGAQTTGTTVVLDDPDIFLEVNIEGIIYYIPAYTT